METFVKSDGLSDYDREIEHIRERRKNARSKSQMLLIKGRAYGPRLKYLQNNRARSGLQQNGARGP